MGVSEICIIPIILLLVNMAETSNTDESIYGPNVTMSQAPFMATLRIYKNEMQSLGSGNQCTAVIIRNRVLLTAAHCLYNRKMSDMVVVIGSTHLRISTPATKMLRISAWRWHPLFTNKVGSPYNLAVVFTYDDIKPIEGAVGYVPINTMEVREGTMCIESGWTGKHLNLQSVWVVSTSRRECINLYRTMGLMCTYSKSQEASIRNDAGAPIVCDGKLSGIAVSIMDGKKETANTALHLYAKWIRAAIYLYFNSNSTTSSPGKAGN